MTRNDGWPGLGERIAVVIGAGLGPARVLVNNAGPTAFLASDRAGYVNGAPICCDGGCGGTLMGLVPRPGFEARDPIGG